MRNCSIAKVTRGRRFFIPQGRQGGFYLVPRRVVEKFRPSFTYVHNRGIILLAAAKRVPFS
jgi:hypothetical protein